jgi:uncharacterized MAPEG superfamily protein
LGFMVASVALSWPSLEAIPLFCIVGALVLVYLPFGVVTIARFQVGYDYAAPRSLFEKLPAYGQRAVWAHENGFESFAALTAAALMVYVTGPHPESIFGSWTGDDIAAGASIVFLVARFLYTLAYIANQPILRSLAWATGSACILALFTVSLLPLGSIVVATAIS